MNDRRTMETTVRTLSVGERLNMLTRTFFVQAVWNPRGMQNVGFCFALLPVLEHLGLDAEGRSRFLTRHLGFFNTNPTLASFVIGATARAEIDGYSRGDGAQETALDVKRSLSAPVAMFGDTLFWASLRPLAVLVGSLLAIHDRIWAPLALLIVYNLPTLWFRVRGLGVGLSRGAPGIAQIAGPRLRPLVLAVRAAAAFAAGALLAAAIARGGDLEPWRFVVAGAVFVSGVLAIRLRVPVTAVAAGAVILGVVLASLGMHGN